MSTKDSLPSAGSFHLCEQLLLHRVQQVRAKVSGMQQDFML